jgi:hypothetical protein
MVARRPDLPEAQVDREKLQGPQYGTPRVEVDIGSRKEQNQPRDR